MSTEKNVTAAWQGSDGESWRQNENVQRNVLNQFDMTGKVALVTGGCGWLGTAFCLALAEAGATVVVTSRDVTRAKSQAQSLPTPNGIAKQPHFAVAMDHLNEESIKVGFKAAVTQLGKVDVLVNNGVSVEPGDIHTGTFDAFAKTQNNNAGYFALGRELRDHCVSRSAPGAIVNIGSMYGQVGSYPDAYTHTNEIGDASPISYHCLKGGTIHMSRHMAVYYAKDNVRVNCLSPGAFPSSKAPAALVDRLNTKVPMQRMGRPDELKGALILLASDAGSYMTGQNLTIDGGWTAW
eukprot:m.91120 g.91120  ORF g.91120 m.91120 type:complete len:294 (-) comp26446_c0_seq3:20-901(-)